ncbi:MAG TPA: hypothetical protein VGV69_06365 [Solirubrobacterales bacterium]|nr:hypothetical protein [Solirubrobacterales bacterium]
MAREVWTDERLDDLNGKVDKGFDRVDADIRELRSEMKSGFGSVQRTMILGFVTLNASFVGGLVATQL